MRPENKKTNVEDVVMETPEPVETAEPIETIETLEPVETVESTPEPEEPKTTFGIVAHCERLNVRVKPSMHAEIACVVKRNAKMEIDFVKSTIDFYKVTLPSGVGGFCMKKFIEIQQ